MNLTKLFAKYIKEPEADKAHAELSASGSERWLKCPASVSLSRGIEKTDSQAGITGTNAHMLLQFLLENERPIQLLGTSAAKAFKVHIGFSKEQLNSVLVAARYIWQLQRQTPIPQLFIEQKMKLDGVGFGTADVILYQPFGLLHIIDFKNGKYKVEPEDNTQGLYYAVAAADKFGWDFSDVWITIIQPNATHKLGPIRTWKTTPERLERAQRMFIIGAARTRMQNPPAIPDHKYCWFCSARPVCPAQMQEKEMKIMSRFSKQDDVHL